jgi:hypothetical protein
MALRAFDEQLLIWVKQDVIDAELGSRNGHVRATVDLADDAAPSEVFESVLTPHMALFEKVENVSGISGFDGIANSLQFRISMLVA